MGWFIHDITLEERAKLQEGKIFSISLDQGAYGVVPMHADLRALTKRQLSRMKGQFAKEPEIQLCFAGRVVARAAFQDIRYAPAAEQPLCALYGVNKTYKHGV